MVKKKMWGGRFLESEDPVFARFNRSLGFDRALIQADIRGSVAYAHALKRAGVFSSTELKRVEAALLEILEEHWSNPDLSADSDSEDVHSYIEELLGRRVGELALKLHTGRSRNDQVATDLRLYMRDQCASVEMELDHLLRSIARLVEREGSALFPGYTHMQLAQPVLFGHYLLAYGEMFLRDRQRLRETASRTNICPLGAGALTGTVYRIDREELANDLGFDSATENSMDAVSDRDYILDFLFFASVLAMHMSRMAEDLILYASAEFGFIVLHDSVSSGSSLMPQKKNPDSLELIRGKSGRVYGHLVGLLTVMKGLPLTYNKDLQEDKEGLFDVVQTVTACVAMLRRVLETLEIRRERMLEAATTGYLNATELADYLVAKGVPFRNAHHLIGRIVLHAAKLGKRLEELPLTDFRKYSEIFDKDLYSWLDLNRAVSRRIEKGGTSPQAVFRALRRYKKRIGA